MIKRAESFALVETIFASFATLIPLYSPIFRSVLGQLKAEIRKYLAPTSCDDILVPHSLRSVARDMAALLPYIAARSESSHEWVALVHELVKAIHETADQAFRCIKEDETKSREYIQSKISFDSSPTGGGSSVEDFPLWIGLQAGSDRLCGLLDCLAHILCLKTRAPVSLPLLSIVEICMRISFVVPIPPKSLVGQGSSSLSYREEAGREEKEELIANLPSIHTSALSLAERLIWRLEKSTMPDYQEFIGIVSRIFDASHYSALVRQTAYILCSRILRLGNSFEKPAVDMLHSLIFASCRDIRTASSLTAQFETEGTLENPLLLVPRLSTGVRNLGQYLVGSSIADNNCLGPPAGKIMIRAGNRATTCLTEAAEQFLVASYDYLPQEHLRVDLRCFMDYTAICCRIRSAMLASILNPYPNRNGRPLPSVLPYLAEQFPNDREVETLRTNLRTRPIRTGDLFSSREDKEKSQSKEVVTSKIHNNNATADLNQKLSFEFAANFMAKQNGNEMDSDAEYAVAKTKQADISVSNTAGSTIKDLQTGAPNKKLTAMPLKRKHEDDLDGMTFQPLKKEKPSRGENREKTFIHKTHETTHHLSPGEIKHDVSDSDDIDVALVVEYESDFD